MYVDYEELKAAIARGDGRYQNYFDTFGFLVIRNVLDPAEFKLYLKEYDVQYRKRTDQCSILAMLVNRLGFSGPKKYGFRVIWRALRGRRGMSFLPGFLEESDVYIKLFLSSKLQILFTYFCGKNWLYLGSDGSRFATTSFPWHRDWFTKVPIMKCNLYFNPLPFFGGKFLLIPGSNVPSDVYTKMIQKCISWPMQNKYPSGVTENNQLPVVKNPRKWLSLRDMFTKPQKFDVPHVAIKLRKGDMVLFDHRMLHCVQSTYPRFERRLLTILIGKNAFDFSDKHYTLEHYSREEQMQELLDLVVNERNHIGCAPWGNELLNTDFKSTTHFIDIRKRGDTGKWDHGSILLDAGKRFESNLNFDKYAKVGSAYRELFDQDNNNAENGSDAGAQRFSYHDVHLGINANNIKKIQSR